MEMSGSVALPLTLTLSPKDGERGRPRKLSNGEALHLSPSLRETVPAGR